MSVRDEMIDLVARLRLEIADAGAPPVFTDDELQDALDGHERAVDYELTDPRQRRAPGGALTWLDHRFGRGFFARDVRLQDANFNDLVTTSADAMNARWTLAQSTRVVYVVGNQFDLYAAAADVFDKWAAKLKTDTDFRDGRIEFHDSQRFEQLERCAKRCRAKRWPATRRLVSTDFTADSFFN